MKNLPLEPLIPLCRMKRKSFDYPHVILWGILSVFLVFACLITLQNVSEFRIQYAPADYFSLALPESNLTNINSDDVFVFVVKNGEVLFGKKSDFFYENKKPQSLSFEDFFKNKSRFSGYVFDFVGVDFYGGIKVDEMSKFVSKISSFFDKEIKITPIYFYEKNEKI